MLKIFLSLAMATLLRPQCLDSFFIGSWSSSIAKWKPTYSSKIGGSKSGLDFDFKSLIAEASRTQVIAPAVSAATDYMMQTDKPLSVGAVTSVIRIYGMAGLVENAINVLWLANKKKVPVNVAHVNAALQVCKTHKRYPLAIKLFDETMESFNLAPNKVTATLMVTIFGEVTFHACS